MSDPRSCIAVNIYQSARWRWRSTIADGPAIVQNCPTAFTREGAERKVKRLLRRWARDRAWRNASVTWTVRLDMTGAKL